MEHIIELKQDIIILILLIQYILPIIGVKRMKIVIISYWYKTLSYIYQSSDNPHPIILDNYSYHFKHIASTTYPNCLNKPILLISYSASVPIGHTTYIYVVCTQEHFQIRIWTYCVYIYILKKFSFLGKNIRYNILLSLSVLHARILYAAYRIHYVPICITSKELHCFREENNNYFHLIFVLSTFSPLLTFKYLMYD